MSETCREQFFGNFENSPEHLSVGPLVVQFHPYQSERLRKHILVSPQKQIISWACAKEKDTQNEKVTWVTKQIVYSANSLKTVAFCQRRRNFEQLHPETFCCKLPTSYQIVFQSVKPVPVSFLSRAFLVISSFKNSFRSKQQIVTNWWVTQN